MAKRALMIGLNYPGTTYTLNGCVNDVKQLKTVLVERFGFPEANITLLLDTEGAEKPTLEAIMRNLDQKVAETQPGDVLFLHYSGHGTQIPDTSNEEADGQDEALVSGDGQPLRDDLLQASLAKLPANVKFTFIADCCHSGTMLDQPVQQVSGDKSTSAEGVVQAENRDFKHRGLSFGDFQNLAGQLSGGGDISQVAGLIGGLLGVDVSSKPIKSVLGFLQKTPKQPKPAQPPANLDTAVLISGCQDSETSADAFINGQYNGALTNAIVTVLDKQPGMNISNKELCVLVREQLKATGYAQNPCLSCGDNQVNEPFIAAI